MSDGSAGKVADRVVWRRVGETVVAVEMGDGSVFELEGPAARIWELLVEGRQGTDLIAALEAEYEVDRATLERDLSRTIDRLAEVGLLER